MKTKDADVIIVGGGPAGSSAAYKLAKQGISTLVIEKQQMPRYKTCGGGVNIRAAKHIPFSIDSVVENIIYKYRFTYQGGKAFERVSNKPLTYMTQRMLLDKLLLDEACKQGATAIQNVSVRKISEREGQVFIEDSNGNTYRSLIAIGADGANSIVAREIGLTNGIQREIALESEILLPPEVMNNWQNTIEIDLFSIWCGYGWIFPKHNHISIGVGGPQKLVKKIKDYNVVYSKRYGLSAFPVERFSGHILPVRKANAPLSKGRILLVGDAAGLLEPFTGEGIGYAVRSGQLAAVAIDEFLRGKIASLDRYTELVNQELASDLIDAQKFVRIFNRFPKLFYHLIKENDYLWGAICKILQGERGFSDVNRRLGPFKHILSFL